MRNYLLRFIILITLFTSSVISDDMSKIDSIEDDILSSLAQDDKKDNNKTKEKEKEKKDKKK